MNNEKNTNTTDGHAMKAISPQPTIFDIPLAEFGEKILKAKSRKDAQKLAQQIANDYLNEQRRQHIRSESRGHETGFKRGQEQIRAEFRELMGVAKKQTIEVG